MKIYKINKAKLIEESIIHKISNFIYNLKNKFTNKFKYLSNDDFEIFLNFLFWHYYKNSKLPKDFLTSKDSKSTVNVLEKIKNNSTKTFPKKLYRGLNFVTEVDYNKFISDSKKYGISSYYASSKEISLASSWSSLKSVAEKFYNKDYFAYDNAKIGVMLEIDYTDYKPYFLFSMDHLLENDNEKKEFIKIIFSDEFYKNMKNISNLKSFKNLDDQKIIGKMHGALFGVIENEYILLSIPFDKVKITKIDVRI